MFAIGVVFAALFILLIPIYLFWFSRNYGHLTLKNNENVCTLAIRAMASPAVSCWIHPDSEYGKLIGKLNELTIISKTKRGELLKLLASGDKKQIRKASEELRELTREMIEIMEETIFSDPLYNKELAKKLAKYK